jgi:hypothetical protein
LDNNSEDRFIIWGSPSLSSLLITNEIVLIDGTFHVVPNPFYQLLIIMVYDRISGSFIPALYIIAISKSENIYLRIYNEIQYILGVSWNPKSFIDFEMGLIAAIR